MKVLPLNNVCYIEELVKTKTDGGLHLPQSSKQRRTAEFVTGIVYAIDPDTEYAKEVRTGDTILAIPVKVSPVKIDGKELLFLQTCHIVGIIARKGDVTGLVNTPISLTEGANN